MVFGGLGLLFCCFLMLLDWVVGGFWLFCIGVGWVGGYFLFDLVFGFVCSRLDWLVC